ncbi:hypothetical protein [Ferdinandcohnia sp. Marseille-Q9671]
MEEDIINNIHDFISGFREKGYSRLARVLNDKLNRYVLKRNNNEWEDKELLKNVKELMTDIMETIYLHIDSGIDTAQTQLEMLDSSIEVFKELGISSEDIKVKNIYKNIESILIVRNQYIDFKDLKSSLITLIKIFKENNYLVESKILDGVLK